MLRMKKIGIDARFMLGERRGIGNYVYALLKSILEQDKTNKYYIYVAGKDSVHDEFSEHENVVWREIKIKNYFIWEQIILPFYLKNDKIDVFHATGNTAPIFMPRKTKLITTIHDVMYCIENEKLIPKPKTIYQKIGRIYRRCIVPIVAKKSCRIITISKFSKADLIKYIPNIINKINVVYEAGTKSIVGKSLSSTREKYILVLGAIDPRKNTRRIIEAYALIKKQKKYSYMKLFICGIDKNLGENILKKISSDVKKDISFLGFVSDEKLSDLYTNAEMFVYMSLYEGFGFPVLDAMKCKTPVIASNITSIPEIVGDAGVLVDPYNVDDISNAMIQIMESNNLRKKLIKLGELRKEEFSWEKNARETIQIYESV